MTTTIDALARCGLLVATAIVALTTALRAPAAEPAPQIPRFLDSPADLGLLSRDLTHEGLARSLAAWLAQEHDLRIGLKVERLRKQGTEIVFEGYQHLNGVRVESANFSGILDASSLDLRVLNSAFFPLRGRVPRRAADAEAMAASALRHTGRPVPSLTKIAAAPPAPARPVSLMQSDRALVRAERVFDPFTERTKWIVTEAEDRYVVDEDTGRVLDSRKLVNNHPATIHHNDIVTGADRVAPANGALPEVDARYPYVLQLGETGGWSRAIDRIVDKNSGETSSPSPFFAASTASSYGRQQSAFYWAERSRRIAQISWSDASTSPDDTTDVRIDVDHDTGECGSHATACFKRWTSWLPFSFLQQPRIAFQTNVDDYPRLGGGVVAHEYGHYFVYTYGDLDFNCKFGSDESDVVNETVADIFANLVAHYEKNGHAGGQPLRVKDQSLHGTSRATNGVWNPTVDNNRDRHYRLTEPFYDDDTNGCHPPSGSDRYRNGNPLKQVVWEVLFGLNCWDDTASDSDYYAHSTASCNDYFRNNSSTYAGELAGLASRTDARTTMVKALGYALDRTGKNPTHYDIARWMRQYVQTYRPQLVTDFEEVLFHHGFFEPVGPRLDADAFGTRILIDWAANPDAKRWQLARSHYAGTHKTVVYEGTANEWDTQCTGCDHYYYVRYLSKKYNVWSRWGQHDRVTTSNGGGGGGGGILPGEL